MLWIGVGASAALLLTTTFRTSTAELGGRPIEPIAPAAPAATTAASTPTTEVEPVRSPLAEQPAPATLDARALREWLESGELRWSDLDDEQRLAVWRLIGRETYGTLSAERQRELVRLFTTSPFDPTERVDPSTLNDVDRRHLEFLKEQFESEAAPIAEQAVAAAAEDLSAAWDRGEGLVIWRTDAASKPAAPECDALGHVRHQCGGWFAPGYEFNFAYSSAQNPAVQSALERVKQMRSELQQTWREYSSTR